jgi:hypothetical protein
MGAILTIRSENKKLGNASALYVSLNACPTDCPLRNSGCYATYGPIALQVARLVNADGHDACLSAADAICDAIRCGNAQRPLRLFVTGDAHCEECARAIADAARAWQRASGQPVWGYTHNWRRIPSDVWYDLSVRASCETDADVADARARGYSVARVVREFPARAWSQDGQRYVACLEQTRGVKCVDCRVCWRAPHLAVAFVAHGNRSAVIRALAEKGS